jgi:GNAT superfamily N-acetyltransferase
MSPDDVQTALQIIRAHDQDDYETAIQSYENYGVEDQYVLEAESRVIGVTGIRYIPDTDRSYFLSWTYLDPGFRGRGLGTAMLEELLSVLEQRGVRKLFVNTSDLMDPKQDQVYRDAIKMYETLGFRLELNYRDYYEPGESRLTYGRRIGPLYALRPVFEPDPAGVRLLGIEEIAETDDAYFVEWEFCEDGSMFASQDLVQLARQAKEWDARCVFAGFPSNLPQMEQSVEGAGFSNCGRLVDFYEDGLDEVHYRLDL